MPKKDGQKLVPPLLLQVLKIANYLERIIRFVLIILMAVMTLVIVYNVFLRNLFSSSLYWAEELARYSLIWLVYLAVGIALKREELVGVLFAVRKTPAKVKKVVTIISLLVMLWFSLDIFINSLNLIERMYQSGHLSAQLMVPMWIIYLCIPLGFLVLSFFIVILLLEKIIGLKNWVPTPGEDNPTGR